MPTKRKPPSQPRHALQDATPNRLNTSAAVENLRNDSERHSVGKPSREDRENHPKFLRKVCTGRCEKFGEKVAKLKVDHRVNLDHASRGTRKFEVWKLRRDDELLKKGESNTVDALRQGLKLFHNFHIPAPDIEIAEDGSIQSRRGPYDYWSMVTKEERFNPISSFTLGDSSSRAERDRSVDTKVCCGDCVELENGAFIEILEIYRPSKRGPVQIRGHLFERNMSLMGWLPRIENEVFWLCTFPMGQDPESAEPFFVEVWSSKVRRKRNLYKAYNSPLDERSSSEQVQDNITGQGILICRWRYVRGIDNKIYRTQYNETTYTRGNFDEKLLIPLEATDSIDGSYSSYKRHCYRQRFSSNPDSPRDDSQERKHISKREDEVTNNRGVPSDRSQRVDNTSSSYTFGDAFAGCGGMSRAALMAELEVKWGFDMDPIAMKAYRMNFPNADARLERADEFVASGTDAKLKVDILHASPPCQPFSIANHAGKWTLEQEQNSAALFAIPEIMKKTDPRVVIIEEVPNIMSEWAEYFSALVQFFTYRGWSIRWKVINCIDFGVRQERRRRLFMIGSR